MTRSSLSGTYLGYFLTLLLTLLFWLLFSACHVFWLLPVPFLIYDSGFTYPPWILAVSIGLIINSIAIVPALFGFRPFFLSRFMIVSALFYCGTALTRIVAQLMPPAIIENPEDDMSGFFQGAALVAFFQIYFITAVLTLLAFDIAGRWVPTLRLSDEFFWRSHFRTMGKVSLFSAIVAMLVFTVLDGWQIRG